MTSDGSGAGPQSWANHPNAALRLSVADFVGRGYPVDMLDATSAVVSKPKGRTRPTHLLVMPFYVMNVARRERVERFLLSVTANDEVRISEL